MGNEENIELEELNEMTEQLEAMKAKLISGKSGTTSKSWKNKLAKDKNNNFLTYISNYLVWLENGSSRYTGKLKFNEFFDCVELDGHIIDDAEIDYACLDAEQFFKHSLNRQNLAAALNIYAHNNAHNPLKSYLDGLKGKWDGKSRIEKYIIDTLDADDNSINRFFSKTWLLGAVKRVYEPGCQFDCVLALQGGIQGAGKTTLFRRLFKEKYYRTFSSGEFSNKDAIGKMSQSWCSLLDEFDKFKESEVADLKCKITEKTMSCRKAYAKETKVYPVHWVYAATTNDDAFLADLTGDEFERRYWIVECKKSSVDSKVSDVLTDEYVDQLWAEAVQLYFEDVNQHLFLSSSNPLFEEYKEYQRRFKKTSKNIAQDYLYEILEKKYDVDGKGQFKDTLDVYNQFISVSPILNGKSINCIPCSFVTHILNKVYGLNYRPKIIKSLLQQMGGEWEIKEQKRYLNKNTHNVLVRVKTKEENQEEEEDREETVLDGKLPF